MEKAKNDFFRFRPVWTLFYILGVCVFSIGCRLVDGQDPGAVSLDSVILNSMVISADCASQSNIAENYSCQPAVKISTEVNAEQLTWEFTDEHTCPWLNINSATGQVFGVPGRAHFKNCVLAFRVKTSEKPVSDYSLSLNVMGPKISLLQKNCSNTVGVMSQFSCDIDATSNLVDGKYTYSLASDNTCLWAAIDVSTGLITGTPKVADSGSCELSVN